jgi:hypothetical protein
LTPRLQAHVKHTYINTLLKDAQAARKEVLARLEAATRVYADAQTEFLDWQQRDMDLAAFIQQLEKEAQRL